jgi:TolA-binding protein
MDIVGLTAVILLFGGLTLFLISMSPIGKALAGRISGKKVLLEDEEIAALVKDLRQELDEMQHLPEQMSELGERVDFLERMVAKQREAERLPPVR